MSSYADTVRLMLDLGRPRPDTVAELQRESDALLWEVERLMLDDDVERVDIDLYDRVGSLAVKLGMSQPLLRVPRRKQAVLDLIYDCQWALRRLGRRSPDDEDEEEAS